MTAIDHERLKALRDDIGEDDFAEVLSLFVSEIGEKLSDLAEIPDRATQDDFHFLRGSAANLGFVAMVAACEDAEAACRAGETPALADVTAAFDTALAEAAPHLPELSAA